MLLMSHTALRAEPLLGLEQFISLLAQPRDHRGLQTHPLLQGRELLLIPHLQFPFLLNLGQKVKDPLAGLSVLLEQLVLLLPNLGGLLVVPP